MGVIERINNYTCEILLWQAKQHELEAEYLMACRAIYKWEFTNREKPLKISMGGNDYTFNGEDVTVQEIETHIQHEYETYGEYIDEIIRAYESQIQETRNYVNQMFNEKEGE